MEERTLRILEFDKIKDKLVSLCSSGLGKELASELLPGKRLKKWKGCSVKPLMQWISF